MSSKILSDAELFSRLVKRTYRYNKLVDIAPQEILKKEVEMLHEVQEELEIRGYGNWKEWLESPQGQTALLLQEDHEKTFIAACDRCGRCSHYCFNGDDYYCEKGVDTLSTVCTAFDDTGEDYAIRAQVYTFERCSTCKKCIIKPLEVIEGEEYKCSVKGNMLAKTCAHLELLRQSS